MNDRCRLADSCAQSRPDDPTLLVAAQLPLQASFVIFVIPALVGCAAVVVVATRTYRPDRQGSVVVVNG